MTWLEWTLVGLGLVVALFAVLVLWIYWTEGGSIEDGYHKRGKR